MKHKAGIINKEWTKALVVMCFVAVIALTFLFTPTAIVRAQICTGQANCSTPNTVCYGLAVPCADDSACLSGVCLPSNTCQGVCISATSLVVLPPITFTSPTGTKTFSDVVCTAITFFSETILPPLAVFMMLVVGFLFMMGGQMPQKAVAAKKTLLYVAAGVMLLILAPKIVGLVTDVVGSSSMSSGISCISTEASTTSIVKTIANLINWFAWFVSITSVAMGLYAGLLYLTARGDSSQVLKATKVFSFTIIGIAVAVVSFSIIILAKAFFGI